MLAATQWAIERAQAGLGTTLIECFTYRAEGHSTSDDPTRYRPSRRAGHLAARRSDRAAAPAPERIGEWDDARHDAPGQPSSPNRCMRQVKNAEAVGPLGKSKPPVTEMFEGVFREPDWRVIEQRREAGVLTDAGHEHDPGAQFRARRDPRATPIR